MTDVVIAKLSERERKSRLKSLSHVAWKAKVKFGPTVNSVTENLSIHSGLAN
jgi:hypothetical protein